MKKSKLNATTMRFLLAVAIVISFVLICFGFYVTRDHLEDIAEAVKSSGTTNSGKASLITYTSSSFQQQAKQDLNSYASSSGLVIQSIEFLPSQNSDGYVQTLTGLQAKSIQISFSGAVPYVNFLKFLKALDTNLPIMRVTNIQMSRDNSDPNNINVGSLIVSVSVR